MDEPGGREEDGVHAVVRDQVERVVVDPVGEARGELLGARPVGVGHGHQGRVGDPVGQSFGVVGAHHADADDALERTGACPAATF